MPFPDNPKDYADNLDATQYDPRLRGPVNERVELAIDPRTGLKNYIANENAGIMTSALHVRKLAFRICSPSLGTMDLIIDCLGGDWDDLTFEFLEKDGVIDSFSRTVRTAPKHVDHFTRVREER